MKRGPLTLLRRTWIVPLGYPDEDDEDVAESARWDNIPAAHVVVERSIPGGKELIVEFGDRQILTLECNHPAFYGWLSGLIDALANALDEPCTPEVIIEEQERWELHQQDANCYKRWRRRPIQEIRNACDDIPAGAIPIWNEWGRASASIWNAAIDDMY